MRAEKREGKKMRIDILWFVDKTCEPYRKEKLMKQNFACGSSDLSCDVYVPKIWGFGK
jgi:hypothetical protein